MKVFGIRLRERARDGARASMRRARGPLAGPVVAAAVILNPRRRIHGLADSKVLSAEERERLAPIIRERALAWAVAWADRDEIDSLNILGATFLAMRRALLRLPVCPTHIQVDGNQLAANRGSATGLHGRGDHRRRRLGGRHQRCLHPRKDLPRRDDAETGCVLSRLRFRGPQRLWHARAPGSADAAPRLRRYIANHSAR